jgi:hypothetical protein
MLKKFTISAALLPSLQVSILLLSSLAEIFWSEKFILEFSTNFRRTVKRQKSI